MGAVARELLSRPDVQQTLQGAVDLAAQPIDRHVYASISVTTREGTIDTPASSDQRASHTDRLQYELGEGPPRGDQEHESGGSTTCASTGATRSGPDE